MRRKFGKCVYVFILEVVKLKENKRLCVLSSSTPAAGAA